MSSVPGSPPVTPKTAEDEAFAPSQAQARLWAGQTFAGAAPLYRMALAFRIRGRLDAPCFQRAFECLVRENAALRTVVDRDGSGQAVCRVMPNGARLDVINAARAGAVKGAEEAWLDSWCRERVEAPFRKEDPLADSALVVLGEEDHLWYFAQHHVVADAWSTSVAFDRMSEIYAALERGVDPAPAAPRDYRDYLAYERRASETESFQRAKAHWERVAESRSQDASGWYALENADRSRSTQTVRVPVRIGQERSRRVRELGGTPGFLGLTKDLSRFHVFATALLAWQRRVGDESPALSLLTPVHNRSSRAFKETLGLFIEVLPLTVQSDPSDSFLDLAARTRASMKALVGHALPGITGSTTAPPGAQAVLNYITSSFEGGFAGRPVETNWLHPGHGDPEHLLRLQVHDFDESGEFLLHFDFHRDAFSGPERRAAVGHFLTVLDALLDDASVSIDGVELLSAKERELRANQLDRVASAPAEEPSVVELIQRQIEERPDLVALRLGQRALTYAELDALASSFTGALAHTGVGSGDLVALSVPRSPELIALMLAVLRLGAAYLPLDRGLPAARLQDTLRLAQPRVVVSDEGAAWDSAGSAPTSVTVGELLAMGKAAADAAAIAPTDRAYVIFTSGSTGHPKGVEIPHRALSRYLHFARGQYTDGPGQVFAFLSPPSVDLSITSIFTPLVSGGTVEIYPEPSDGRDLAIFDVVDQDRCDIVKLTPAHLALLVQRGPVAAQRLRVLIVGGENLKRSLARRVQDEFGPQVAIFNEYGPTEAAVGCMVHRFDLEDTASLSVPIGLPIDGVRLHIVNQANQPVPDGVAGELLIGGFGLASGYLRDRAATALSFIPNPVLQDGSRVYRTGDLARIDPRTGRLVFLGRRDGQVKVRGVRIELAEIESALESLQEVDACVVTAPASTEERSGRSDLSLGDDPRWIDVTHCVRCGLASNHPEARLSDSQDGVCAVCHDFERYESAASRYFGTERELRERLDRGKELAAKNGSDFDCLALLSGGKDSTYALYQLVELGYRPLVFSLDNGYISEGAKANIQRVVEHLGLKLEFVGTGSTNSMNAIFSDSLDRFSNVCQGCFKTIYTLATNLARERGIRTIVTGLSRGQIYETRLAPIFRSGIVDPAEIERFVIDARKTYHRADDAVARHLDVAAFEGDEIFDEIEFVDFYRYWDVPLSEVLDFIEKRAAWRRPADTGRSTNCLINDVGIAVHKRERGFHNYALPYSWDVRLGHKTRDECLDELNDDIDEERVQRILREVGADRPAHALTDERKLVAYFVPGEGSRGAEAADTTAIRKSLAQVLPESMIPQIFVPMASLPITPAGKIDRGALPDPSQGTGRLEHVAPRTELERTLAKIWSGVLQVEDIGIHDHFLELGGDSILGIQMVARARAMGWAIAPRDVFTSPTIAELAGVAREIGREDPESPDRPTNGDPLGEVPLTPIQAMGLASLASAPGMFGMSVVLESACGSALQETELRTALLAVTRHHDALRSRFTRSGVDQGNGGWVQEVLHPDDASAPWLEVHGDCDLEQQADELEKALHGRFDLDRGLLLAAAILRSASGHPDRLVVAVHHLVIDAVSWEPLLTDLNTAYDAAIRNVPAVLPLPTTAWRDWARFLRDSARSGAFQPLAERWHAPAATGSPTPSNGVVGDELSASLKFTPEASALAKELGAADALLAALAFARQSAPGSVAISIDVESHGRAELPIQDPTPDVSRTVGWFTAISPVVLPPAETPLDALEGVREHRRTVGNAEAAFGYLKPSGRGPSEVLFNHLGSHGAAIKLAPSAATPRLRPVTGVRLIRSDGVLRTHRLDVHSIEADSGVLVVTVQFCGADDSHTTIAELLNAMEAAVLAMDGAPTGPSPGNSPELELSDDDLKDLLEDYG